MNNNPVSFVDPLGLFVMGGGGGGSGDGSDDGGPNPFMAANLCFPGECLSNIMSLLGNLPLINLNRLGGLGFPQAAEGPAVSTFPNGTNLSAVGSYTVIPGMLLPNGDVAVGMNIFQNSALCPNCGSLWQQSSKTVNVLGAATAAAAVAPAVAVLEGADATTTILELGQSLALNPSVTGFLTDLISGATPLTMPPATLGGLAGVGFDESYESWNQ